MAATTLKSRRMSRTIACAFALMAAPLVCAETRTAGDAPPLRAMLLQPPGWNVVWAQGPERGTSDVQFVARREKLVARIRTPAALCEHDVTITGDTVAFDGCQDQPIMLRFDPGDRIYPFKGTSASGHQYRAQPR